jgi:hypothetical protein
VPVLRHADPGVGFEALLLGGSLGLRITGYGIPRQPSRPMQP